MKYTGFQAGTFHLNCINLMTLKSWETAWEPMGKILMDVLVLEARHFQWSYCNECVHKIPLPRVGYFCHS